MAPGKIKAALQPLVNAIVMMCIAAQPTLAAAAPKRRTRVLKGMDAVRFLFSRRRFAEAKRYCCALLWNDIAQPEPLPTLSSSSFAQGKRQPRMHANEREWPIAAPEDTYHVQTGSHLCPGIRSWGVPHVFFKPFACICVHTRAVSIPKGSVDAGRTGPVTLELAIPEEQRWSEGALFDCVDVFAQAAPATPTTKPKEAKQPAPETGRKLNPQLLNLPANTWVHLRPARNPMARSYSGICWGAGMIYYFGGGHHSYPGNDVELYDVAANTWTQATEPEDWRQCGGWTHITEPEKKIVRGIGGGWGVGVLSPKGRPLTQHTFQMHVYFPEEKAFYNLLQAAGLWAFDPTKRQWHVITKKTPRGSDIHSWNLAYDPQLKTVFTIVTQGAKGVHVFDRAAKTFVRKYPVPVSGYHVYSTYDSARKVHVVRAARKWWTLDLASGTTTLLKNLPGAGPSLSLEYDPESRMTLALIKGKGTELWAYDPGKDEWSQVPMAGKAPAGTTDWDLLVYDENHKCFLFLNVRGVQGARTDGLFAFRYRK